MRTHRLAVALVLVLAACGPRVATIEMVPEKVTLTERNGVQTILTKSLDKERKRTPNVPLAFTSADPTIAPVDANGAVRGLKTGETTVRATAENGVFGEVKVVVSLPASIMLSSSEIAFDSIGQKTTIVAKVLDEAGKEVPSVAVQWVSWENPSPQVVSVNRGEFTAAGPGTASVAAVAGSVRALVKVTVPAPRLDAVEVNPPKLELKVGGVQKLAPVAKAVGGMLLQNAAFSFTSENPKVVKVDATGSVTAVGKGKTRVLVATGDKKATVEVSVAKK